MHLIDKAIPFMFMKLLFLNKQYEYTKLSLALVVYALYRKNSCFTQMICINSTSVFVSFHTSLILDKHIFHKFCNKWNMDLRYFCVMDMLTHILPLVVLLYVNRQNLQTRQQTEKIGWYHGVFTSGFHVFWCLMANDCSLDLSDLYVFMKPCQWYTLWSITIFSHIGCALLMAKT